MATEHNFVNTAPTPKTLDLHEVLSRIHRSNDRLDALVSSLRNSVHSLTLSVDLLDGQRPQGGAAGSDEAVAQFSPADIPGQMNVAIDTGGGLASDIEALINEIDEQIGRLNRRIGSPLHAQSSVRIG